MKSVLISIRPEWCGKIANGTKTLEVRKTIPKIDTSFKCYIYCTKDNFLSNFRVLLINGHIANGKVIGEFTCYCITPITYNMDGYADYYDCKFAQMKPSDFARYGGGKSLFGWRIDDLVIYDKPKELSEFICRKPLERPPQSWCYVNG